MLWRRRADRHLAQLAAEARQLREQVAARERLLRQARQPDPGARP